VAVRDAALEPAFASGRRVVQHKPGPGDPHARSPQPCHDPSLIPWIQFNHRTAAYDLCGMGFDRRSRVEIGWSRPGSGDGGLVNDRIQLLVVADIGTFYPENHVLGDVR